MPKVRLYTPMSPALSAGIICFDVEGHRPAEVVAHLHARGIVGSTSPYPVSYARIAPSLLLTRATRTTRATTRALRALSSAGSRAAMAAAEAAEVDQTELDAIVLDAYRTVAPKTLQARLDRPWPGAKEPS